jgi:ribosomal protein S18 acetylase RimI-like enzyme
MTAGTPAVTLRRATDADEEFLRGLYASMRQDLTGLPWDAATRNALLRLQFDAQDRSWRRSHPEADFDVALVDDELVGRLVVDRSGAKLQIVDIGLSPERRGHGIGTALLERVTHEADERKVAVVLHVERGNAAARRLYERLGFTAVDEDDFRVRMRRDPVS